MNDTRHCHFLIVEDDDDHAELIGLTLMDGARSTFDRVADGPSAIQYLRREGEFADRPRPDVVLLDLNLPGLDGHQVLRIIKHDEMLRTIPVVMLTTSRVHSDRMLAYENHVNSYLVKPLDFTQFDRLIRELRMYWANLNESLEHDLV